ncbi:unnamed protein product [Lampetra planeri]
MGSLANIASPELGSDALCWRGSPAQPGRKCSPLLHVAHGHRVDIEVHIAWHERRGPNELQVTILITIIFMINPFCRGDGTRASAVPPPGGVRRSGGATRHTPVNLGAALSSRSPALNQ